MIPGLRAQHRLRLVGRVFLWLTVAFLLARGVIGVLGSGGGTSVVDDPGSGFPIAEAEAFAERLARDYMSYDEASPQTRRTLLAAYLPAGVDVHAGWDGAGRQTVTASHAVDVAIEDAAAATVTVAVQLDASRWRYVAVPVQAREGRFVAPALPWLVAAPEPADASEAEAGPLDRDGSESAWPALEVFFDAYARGAGTDLAYLSAPGSGIRGLDGAVELEAVVDVAVQRGDGSARAAHATVRWRDPISGAGLDQTYHLALVQSDGRWLVSEIGPRVDPGKES